MRTVLINSGLSLIIVTVLCIFYGLFKYEGHYDFWWALLKKHDEGVCFWTLPKGYEVVSNGTQYSVKIGGDRYVWLRIHDLGTLYEVESNSMFEDSCKAKLLAFMYYDQQIEKAQRKVLIKPFVVVKPPRFQVGDVLKATDYHNIVYISGDTARTREESQLIDEAIKDLQEQGGGSILVERTQAGLYINSQTNLKQ